MLRFPQMNRWLDDMSAFRQVGLDTNVIIYSLENVAPYRELTGQVLRLMDRGLIVGHVSTVVETEVLVKPMRDRNRRALETIELFFRNSPNLVIRSVDRMVARRAAAVRASSRLSLPDATIVATALEDRCDALIGNDSSVAKYASGIPYLYLNDYLS